jgi:hypothetical protein
MAAAGGGVPADTQQPAAAPVGVAAVVDAPAFDAGCATKAAAAAPKADSVAVAVPASGRGHGTAWDDGGWGHAERW